MSDETTYEVAFDIHGAVCHGCDQMLFTIQHQVLGEFAGIHHRHAAFAWLCKITSPAHLVSNNLVEMSFAQGMVN